MNRVILIGNGFDLAHGLKTSYNDFILDIWRDKIIKELENSLEVLSIKCENSVFCVHPKCSGGTIVIPNNIKSFIEENLSVVNCEKLEQVILENNRNGSSVSLTITFKNKFIECLLKSHSNKGWIDIEAEYYRQLKSYATIQDEKTRIESIKILNQELDQVKDLLDEYLQETTQPNNSLFLSNLEGEIYSSFKENDFADIGTIWDTVEPIYSYAKSYFYNTEGPLFNIKCFAELKEDNKSFEDLANGCIHKFYLDKSPDLYYYYNWRKLASTSLDEIIKNTYFKDEVLKHFAIPKDILLLNFNYTSTSDLYAKQITTNHIHGELNQKESSISNPIIFGYGDELSEDYKKLENLNENDVLENVKSIRYLETDNYRNLLSFIESDQYQIYIMGHSCGISDRTLLNTLFEHENCVSIKPFYYEWKDENGNICDNYRELIQNISRNFNDKQVMRSKVVNKRYCKPLPQALCCD